MVGRDWRGLARTIDKRQHSAGTQLHRSLNANESPRTAITVLIVMFVVMLCTLQSAAGRATRRNILGVVKGRYVSEARAVS